MATRKASDHFTRFTSTTPHATSYQIPRSSPSFASSSPTTSSGNPRSPPRSNGPPGETPAQKVARLRAAHRAAQEAASYSRLDRIIATGRVVADKVHRGTAYSLMGITVIAGGLSVFSFFSLIRHHRRQKRAWIERELQRLSDAQSAFLRGEATAEQLHLLEQERAGEEMAVQRGEQKKRKKANSLWGKTKRAIYNIGGVTEEESLGEKARKGELGGVMDMVREKQLDADRLLSDGDGYVEVYPASTSGLGIRDAVDRHRRTGENESIARTDAAQQGGLLDQMAQNTVHAVADGGKSWFSWSGKR